MEYNTHMIRQNTWWYKQQSRYQQIIREFAAKMYNYICDDQLIFMGDSCENHMNLILVYIMMVCFRGIGLPRDNL